MPATIPSHSPGQTRYTTRSSAPAAPDTLAQSIDSVIASNPTMQYAQWGLVVQDDSGQVLYEQDADKLFVPASNLKLITAATANTLLGPNSVFTTHLLSDGKVDANGVLHGNLYLVGGGDPSLSTADLQKAAESLPFHSVEGNLVVDDHVFDTTPVGPGWAQDDLSQAYGAEADGLTLDENAVSLHVAASGVTAPPNNGYLTIHNHATSGSRTDVDAERELGTNVIDVDGTVAANQPADVAVSVHDPALYAGNVFKSLCQARGIEVRGNVVRGTAPGTTTSLWQKASDPLIQLERHMLKESDNLYGETLFRALAKGQSADAPGIEQKTLSIDTPCRIVDGCGLSRYDLASPRLLSNVIQEHYRDPGLRDCLPVAGVDGTLIDRMPTLKGRVEAKTGTMGGVSTLTGWLTLQNGKQVSFSWMCNAYAGPAASEKQTEDSLLVAIDKALSAQ